MILYWMVLVFNHFLQTRVSVHHVYISINLPLFKKNIYIENMPTTGSWHRLTVWVRNRLSSVSRNQTRTLPATNYWEQSVYKWKMAVSLITCTVADPGFALGPLRVRFLKNFGPLGVRSESAWSPLLGVCFAHSCMREADPALLLPSTSPAPCVFQIHCPVSSLCSSYRKHTHVQDSQVISWRTSTKSPEFRLMFGKELLLWANMFFHRWYTFFL